MNVDDKIVVGDSGEGIAEVGGGTDEGVGGVYAGTNVVGSDRASDSENFSQWCEPDEHTCLLRALACKTGCVS